MSTRLRVSRRSSHLAGVVPTLFRSGMRALSAAAPPIAGRVAFEVFLRPPRIRPHPKAVEIFARGRRFAVPMGRKAITAWTWGSGPAMLMTHGWGGRASQLVSFIDPLLERGLRVVTYDAPAHGSSPGRHTNVRHLADAVRAVADTVGGVDGVIAHSLGVTAALLATHHGLAIARAAFVAPPDDLGHFFEGFATRVGLNAAALHDLERRIERATGVPWREFRADRIGQCQHVPLLIVHDEDDHEVPISHAYAWHEAWPGAEMIRTTGLGHRSVLRNRDVVQAVAQFLARDRNPATEVVLADR